MAETQATAGEAIGNNNPKKNKPLSLYKDKYVELTEKGIIIDWYYFPIGMKKFIPYSEIKSAKDAETDLQLFSMLDYKAWGMEMNNIWVNHLILE
jgi:hypothetical protein